MLDGLKKKMAETMGRTVKEVAEPIRNEVKETVDGKVDLYSKILKLGLLVILFIEGSKRVSNMDQEQRGPSQIVINNYLTTGKDGEE